MWQGGGAQRRALRMRRPRALSWMLRALPLAAATGVAHGDALADCDTGTFKLRADFPGAWQGDVYRGRSPHCRPQGRARRRRPNQPQSVVRVSRACAGAERRRVAGCVLAMEATSTATRRRYASTERYGSACQLPTSESALARLRCGCARTNAASTYPRKRTSTASAIALGARPSPPKWRRSGAR